MPSSLSFGRGSNLIAKRAKRLVEIARRKRDRGPQISGRAAAAALLLTFVMTICVWLPVDVLASPESTWSPWPKWSASVLHDFGVTARDFDVYDHRIELHDLFDDDDDDDDDDRVFKPAPAAR